MKNFASIPPLRDHLPTGYVSLQAGFWSLFTEIHSMVGNTEVIAETFDIFWCRAGRYTVWNYFQLIQMFVYNLKKNHVITMCSNRLFSVKMSINSGYISYLESLREFLHCTVRTHAAVTPGVPWLHEASWPCLTVNFNILNYEGLKTRWLECVRSVCSVCSCRTWH